MAVLIIAADVGAKAFYLLMIWLASAIGASELSKRNVVDLDPERRAAMVSNLLVVLCGERGTQPIVNTGSIY